MVEVLLHFAVPFASFRAIGLDWRKAAVASLIALTPDLDVLFHVHRSLTHSAVVLALVWLGLMSATFLIPAGKRRAARSMILLGGVGLVTHLALDLFGYYIPILWPLLNDSFWISTDLHLHIESLPFIAGSVRLLSAPTVFESFDSIDALAVTDVGLGVSLVLLVPSIVTIIRNRGRTNS